MKTKVQGYQRVYQQAQLAKKLPREKAIDRLWELLYKITEEQDKVNLTLMGYMRDTDPNCSKDERWIPIHMVDNANAIILGLARNKGRRKAVVSEGYVGEKVDRLNSRWFEIKS